ncbi:hypothetical protein CJ026_000055 [Ralstonia pickettii]|jgi:hypothetical protein|nr:hypothetical protein CJ026_000055 [Ralstonia pickettii]
MLPLASNKGVLRAGYVKLANRQAGYLSSLSLIRTSCSTGILLCEATAAAVKVSAWRPICRVLWRTTKRKLRALLASESPI